MDSPNSPATITRLVNDLFTTYRHPSGREYTNREVERALDGALEASYLSKLRSGHIANPGRDVLLALCRFFPVKPNYFFPELDQLPQPGTVPNEADPVGVALRSLEVHPNVKRKLADLIKALEQHEDPQD